MLLHISDITIKSYQAIRFVLIVVVVFVTSLNNAIARPVSYEDGWTAMIMTDEFSSSVHIHYSPTVNYSIGYRYEDFEMDSFYFLSLLIN